MCPSSLEQPYYALEITNPGTSFPVHPVLDPSTRPGDGGRGGQDGGQLRGDRDDQCEGSTSETVTPRR